MSGNDTAVASGLKCKTQEAKDNSGHLMKKQKTHRRKFYEFRVQKAGP